MSRAVVDNYQQMQITTSDPAELLILTYETGLKAMRQAERSMKRGETSKANSEVLRAVAAVLTLDETLDVDAAPVGPHLRRIYRYVRRRLLHATSGNDASGVTESIAIMGSLLDAWKQAAAGATA